jgi:hypothetical protein
VSALRASEAPGSPLPLFGECNLRYAQQAAALWRGDLQGSRRIGAQVVATIQRITPHGGFEEFNQNACIFYPDLFKAQAEYLLGDYAAAEKTVDEALQARKHWPINTVDSRREANSASTILALSLAGQHRADEARSILAPVVKFYHELAARNHGDQQLRFELARTLYAQAIIEPANRAALLREAASLLDAVPPQMQALRSVQLWRVRVREALHGIAAARDAASFAREPG